MGIGCHWCLPGAWIPDFSHDNRPTVSPPLFHSFPIPRRFLLIAHLRGICHPSGGLLRPVVECSEAESIQSFAPRSWIQAEQDKHWDDLVMLHIITIEEHRRRADISRAAAQERRQLERERGKQWVLAWQKREVELQERDLRHKILQHEVYERLQFLQVPVPSSHLAWVAVSGREWRERRAWCSAGPPWHGRSQSRRKEGEADRCGESGVLFLGAADT